MHKLSCPVLHGRPLEPPVVESGFRSITMYSWFEKMTLDELEKWAILAAVKRRNSNLMAAARDLDINRTTLYRKLKKYGWERNGDSEISG